MTSHLYRKLPEARCGCILCDSCAQVSGGFLALLDSETEVTQIRRHLLDHIASNICE